MKKKILFIVLPIVLATIIVGIGAIAVISSISNKNKSVGTIWGDTYYAYLKEAINEKDLSEAEEKFGMQLGMKDAKIGFYDIEESENAGFIHTELEKKELVFGKESIDNQLIITIEMYYIKNNNFKL